MLGFVKSIQCVTAACRPRHSPSYLLLPAHLPIPKLWPCTHWRIGHGVDTSDVDTYIRQRRTRYKKKCQSYGGGGGVVLCAWIRQTSRRQHRQQCWKQVRYRKVREWNGKHSHVSCETEHSPEVLGRLSWSCPVPCSSRLARQPDLADVAFGQSRHRLHNRPQITRGRSRVERQKTGRGMRERENTGEHYGEG